MVAKGVISAFDLPTLSDLSQSSLTAMGETAGQQPLRGARHSWPSAKYSNKTQDPILLYTAAN